jgi:hypothetical protein
MKLRWIRKAADVPWMRAIKNAYKILVGKPERKRPLGINRHRWQNNIEIDP